MLNNVCLDSFSVSDSNSNKCINEVFKAIDATINEYTPKETKQDYKTLCFEGLITDVTKCTFDKPKREVDIYTTINDTPMCIGTLKQNGVVELGNLSKSIVCTETYSWNRSMSRVVASCFNTPDNKCYMSYVAVECPKAINTTLDYYYYLDNCCCGSDIRGCPIYNDKCLIHKTFKSGCKSENGCCIETKIFSTAISEQYFNIFNDSYNSNWVWKKREDFDSEYLGYCLNNNCISQYPSTWKYDETSCDCYINTSYKPDCLCTQYQCLRCYKGPYGQCIEYPYKEDCKDVILTQGNSCLATISHGSCFCCFLSCDNFDLLDLSQWNSKDNNCYRVFGNGCLIGLNTYTPTFVADDYIHRCGVRGWDPSGCWECCCMKPDYIINGNPNTIYFSKDSIINITECEDGKVAPYDEKCYKKYFDKLKVVDGLFTTEPTEKISCCNVFDKKDVATGTRFGNQRASIIYCVVQTTYQPTIDISKCCITIKENYL